MEMEFDLHVSEPINEAALDQGGGRVPPGWYLARVEEIFPDPENPAWKLKYEITFGPFKGKNVPDTLWDPREAETEEAGQKSQQRLLMVTKRIGARKDDSIRINFSEAVGKPVVLHMGTERCKRCPNCQQFIARQHKGKSCPTCDPAQTGKVPQAKLEWVEKPDGYVNVEYDGVYPLDHDQIPDEVRNALQITVPKRVTVGLAPNLRPGAATKTKPAASGAATRSPSPTIPFPAGQSPAGAVAMSQVAANTLDDL